MRGRLLTVAAAAVLLASCPERTPVDDLPSCEELGCGGATVCLDGACRPRSCLDLACDEGFVCQPGPECRPATEDRDGDGVAAQLDCDDDEPARRPGGSELCDGLDNDCDGVADDEAPCREGQQCCGEAGCVNPLTSHDHCGGCGSACELYEECVEALCEDAPPPEVTAVSPDPLPTGQWLEIVIAGAHLLGYATVFIEAEGGAADPFEVVARVDGAYFTDQPVLLDGERLPAGRATLRVERNDGLESAAFPVEILGAAAPTIDSFSPDPLPLADDVGVSVTGTGFWGAPRLFIAPDEAGAERRELPLRWVDATWLRTEDLRLDPLENPPGPWVAVAQNPDGLESEPFPFVMAAPPPPSLTSISPTEGSLGRQVVLEVYGFDMYGPPDLLMAPEGETDPAVGPLPIDLFDPSRLVTDPVDLLPSEFTAGRWFLWVRNPDGAESNRLPFQVLE